MEACLPSSLQQNANDVYNKKLLASETAAFTFISHLRLLSSSVPTARARSEIASSLPEIQCPDPSRRRTNEQEKQARGGRSCAGDEGQGRAGVSRLCGAPASHRGAWTVLVPLSPGRLGAQGIRAALKWPPALRAGGGMLKAKDRLPSQAALAARERPPPSSRRDVAMCPRIWGCTSCAMLGDLRLHLTLQKVTPAPISRSLRGKCS